MRNPRSVYLCLFPMYHVIIMDVFSVPPPPRRQLLETIDTSTPRDERGDLLVFLSGMSDMLAVTEGVREYVEAKSPRRWVVLMLHSSLSVEEQDKVPRKIRKQDTGDGYRICFFIYCSVFERAHESQVQSSQVKSRAKYVRAPAARRSGGSEWWCSGVMKWIAVVASD